MDEKSALIASAEDLGELVEVYGFLPFFKNELPGFSVEEHTPPNLWFVDDADGPWEWKGPVIRSTGCAYGKFFRGKSGFISKAWYPDFANYRRDGYDFDARYDDGLVRYKDKAVYDVLCEHDSLLSKEWKQLSGFGKNGRKGFEPILTRLQMQCYVTTVDFEYQQDRYGNIYGWGIARYATPEKHYGGAFKDCVYRCSPTESKERILRHLMSLFPLEKEEKLEHWLK